MRHASVCLLACLYQLLALPHLPHFCLAAAYLAAVAETGAIPQALQASLCLLAFAALFVLASLMLVLP
jgi:hypothetical protein